MPGSSRVARMAAWLESHYISHLTSGYKTQSQRLRANRELNVHPHAISVVCACFGNCWCAQVGRSQVATCCGIDCDGRPMLSVPSAPRLLATCSPLANAGLASLMLPTSLLPEFSSPDFSLSLLPATLSTQSCFLGEPFAREALLRGTTGVASRDHASIFGPETR